jgi:RNA binding exosome subunit
MTEEQKAILRDIARDLEPLVRDIEDSPMTTQNHYGDYMSVLSQAGDSDNRRFIALALIDAGANKQGVRDALRAHGL